MDDDLENKNQLTELQMERVQSDHDHNILHDDLVDKSEESTQENKECSLVSERRTSCESYSSL